MREFKNGTLRSSDGKKVTSRKQALAIAMSESEDYAEKADLISAIHIGSIREAEEILKAAGTEGDLFEKAHKVGDVHPNGKWVWTEYKPGKFDWRGVKGGAKGGSKATVGVASSSKTTSSSYFSKLSNSLIEKYSKKKESVSLSDIEEFYEDFLRDRSQEPTRKVYANEAKKTYYAIVASWHRTCR